MAKYLGQKSDGQKNEKKLKILPLTRKKRITQIEINLYQL